MHLSGFSFTSCAIVISLGAIMGHTEGVTDFGQLVHWATGQYDPMLCWDDIAWVKQRWGGRLILKGILDVEDARLAVQVGADALIVSNHGGRQLDGASSTVNVPPAIAEAVGDHIEVWLDGGVRSGQDVIKALALAASGAMIGRAHLYGLGGGGEEGVRKVLELIAREMGVTLALCGYTHADQVDRQILMPH